MRYIRITSAGGSRPTNPFVQALGLIVGIIAFIAAVFLGGIVLVALIGFMLVAGIILYIRIWWLTRKAGLQRRDDSFVEAEYEVLDTKTADDDRPGSAGK